MVARKPEYLLIVGLGNLLRRDDGVGCRVVERLREYPLPPHVRVVDAGTGGLTVLSLLQGYSEVYLIDAMAAQLAPGTIVRRRLSQLQPAQPERGLSPHDCRVLGVFQLAEALGEHHDPVVFGVQPWDTSYGMVLSDPVQEAVDRLVGIILDEIFIDSDLDEGDDSHD